MALPIPLPAPVTMTFFPLNRISLPLPKYRAHRNEGTLNPCLHNFVSKRPRCQLEAGEVLAGANRFFANFRCLARFFEYLVEKHEKLASVDS